MLGTALALLVALLALGIPIAAVLGVVALGFGYLFSPMPLYRAMGQLFWENGNSFLLLSLPLFILMGELMLRAGIAEKMYNSLAQWLSWLPGRPHARQCRGERDLRGDVGLECGDRGDDRHRRCPAD
jgi:C4-dicarboxylate transporter DctM subunit